MRVVVASCFAYRDTWRPFFQLFEKFWPGNDYPYLLSDEHIPSEFNGLRFFPLEILDRSWCGMIAELSKHVDDPILLLLDDFFLNAPVNEDLINHGLEILKRDNVGAVRLYPCPGATEPSNDPYYGPVRRHSEYRNSLQCSLWRPEYLHAIASRFNTPQEFELKGSPWASSHLPAEVWAFKREVEPWPISYECTAIVKARWTRSALELCAKHGITVDTSLREIEAA